MALAFFFGIVINLTVLGAIAGKLGELLTEAFGQYWAIGMALVSFIVAAFAFLGPRLKTPQLEHLRRPGVIGSFIYGFIFSLGTSAAPLLLLLTVAAAQRSVETGFVLAVFFGIGRGVPFLLIGFFAGLITKFAELMQEDHKWLRHFLISTPTLIKPKRFQQELNLLIKFIYE